VGADHLAIAGLEHYLRGRTAEDIVDRLRAGAADAGMDDVPVHADELTALRAMLDASSPGDVVAVTALGMRPEIFAWLGRRRATRMTPADVRTVARRAAASKRRLRGTRRDGRLPAAR